MYVSAETTASAAQAGTANTASTQMASRRSGMALVLRYIRVNPRDTAGEPLRAISCPRGVARSD